MDILRGIVAEALNGEPVRSEYASQPPSAKKSLKAGAIRLTPYNAEYLWLEVEPPKSLLAARLKQPGSDPLTRILLSRPVAELLLESLRCELKPKTGFFARFLALFFTKKAPIKPILDENFTENSSQACINPASPTFIRPSHFASMMSVPCDLSNQPATSLLETPAAHKQEEIVLVEAVDDPNVRTIIKANKASTNLINHLANQYFATSEPL